MTWLQSLSVGSAIPESLSGDASFVEGRNLSGAFSPESGVPSKGKAAAASFGTEREKNSFPILASALWGKMRSALHSSTTRASLAELRGRS